jgi:hypothetical protein
LPPVVPSGIDNTGAAPLPLMARVGDAVDTTVAAGAGDVDEADEIMPVEHAVAIAEWAFLANVRILEDFA